MNNFKLIFLAFLIACSSGVGGDQRDPNGIILSGTVGYPQQGLIILEKIEGNRPVPIDTLTLQEDYTFSTQVVVNEPSYYRLNFYDMQFVPLILHKDDVQVNVDGNARNGFFSVSGSHDHDFIENAQQLFQDFQSSEMIRSINQQFGIASAANDRKAMDSLRVAYLELESGIRQQLVDVIDTMHASLGVVEILRSGSLLDKDKYYHVLKEYAQVLREEIPQSALAQDFIREVEQMGKLAIGQPAPEIELPNPDGEVIKLSSLRGKYVLVDFWAKWCKPCRLENPNVVRMYKKYNDKGFEVFGVSLDRRREDWIQAIEEDGLHWTQVSDLKFWNSKAAEIYNIKAIPFAVLLNPEGVIIGKNLRGRELENKLEEIFSKEG